MSSEESIKSPARTQIAPLSPRRLDVGFRTIIFVFFYEFQGVPLKRIKILFKTKTRQVYKFFFPANPYRFFFSICFFSRFQNQAWTPTRRFVYTKNVIKRTVRNLFRVIRCDDITQRDTRAHTCLPVCWLRRGRGDNAHVRKSVSFAACVWDP